MLSLRHRAPRAPTRKASRLNDFPDAAPGPSPSAKPRVTARQRAMRDERIVLRMQEGWTYEANAAAERLSVGHVRDIVMRAMRGREPDGPNEHTRLQKLRLAPSMRVAAEAVAAGDLRAIDRMLRLLDRLDRYNSADRVTEESKEETFRILKERIDRHARKNDLERERWVRRHRKALARLATLGFDEKSATADLPDEGSGESSAAPEAQISVDPPPLAPAADWEKWRIGVETG